MINICIAVTDDKEISLVVHLICSLRQVAVEMLCINWWLI